MFELSVPWWSLLARGAIVYVALMVLLRLSGKRTVGEFTPFDLVVVVLLGEAAQGSLTGGDESLLGGLIVAATLIGLNYAVGFGTARSATFDKLVEGEAVLLVRNGQVHHRALKRNNIPETDLEEAVRRAGHATMDKVELAMLESSGEITVVPARTPPAE